MSDHRDVLPGAAGDTGDGADRAASRSAPGGPGAPLALGSARTSLAAALASQVLVLDGAMGTELQARGVDTARALWSAQALLDAPDAVTGVHAAYLAAGADVIETNSYQATVPALADAGYDEVGARDLIASSARLALAAAQAVTARGEPTGPAGSTPGQSPGQGRSPAVGGGAGQAVPGGRPDPFVAGALGPYGAFLADGSEYTGAYEASRHELERIHLPRVEALAGEGVRLFAVETMPRLDEVQTLVTLLGEVVPGAECWVSFQVRPDGVHLADGTPLAQAAAWADTQEAVVAVGLNCVAPETVSRALPVLRGATGRPLVAYPNSGDSYDPVTKDWSCAQDSGSAPGGAAARGVTAGTAPGSGHGHLADIAEGWLEAGVRLVGGCCRTTPTDTAALAGLVAAAGGGG